MSAKLADLTADDAIDLLLERLLTELDDRGLMIVPKPKTEPLEAPVSIKVAAEKIKAAGFSGWSKDSLLRWGHRYIDGKQVVPVRFGDQAELLMSEFWAIEPELSMRKQQWKYFNKKPDSETKNESVQTVTDKKPKRGRPRKCQ